MRCCCTCASDNQKQDASGEPAHPWLVRALQDYVLFTVLSSDAVFHRHAVSEYILAFSKLQCASSWQSLLLLLRHTILTSLPCFAHQHGTSRKFNPWDSETSGLLIMCTIINDYPQNSENNSVLLTGAWDLGIEQEASFPYSSLGGLFSFLHWQCLPEPCTLSFSAHLHGSVMLFYLMLINTPY